MNDLSEYRKLISTKRIAAIPTGISRTPKLNSSMFDYQESCTQFALRAGRSACFLDTGLGKSFIALEWGRCVVEETNKPVLMLAPLGVVHQHLAEAERVGVEAKVSRTGVPPETPQIVITNYDRLERFDPDAYGGVILDESSILKSFSGVTTRKLIDTFKNTPFRLCCSATPAPNDHMELGQHSEFLSVLSQSQMLVRWFLHDSADTGTWRLKGHATQIFWDWVASWSRCLSKPSDLGFSDIGFEMPPLNVHKHIVAADRSQDSGAEKDGQIRLFRIPDTSATSIHKEKRLTKNERAIKVAELMAREPDEPWIVWCDTNYDADALRELMPNINEVRGNMSPDVKEDRLNAFTTGQSLTMLTKASIAGYGLNWQHCARMAFMGLSFSYENYYQAIRRCWRFRQKRAVEVHVICADTEASIWDVVSRKSGDHEYMKAEMSAAMARAHRSSEVLSNYRPQMEASIPKWI
jgi:superfamily II DNA or RNA helicase